MPSLKKGELYFLDTNVIVYAMGRSPDAPIATQRLEVACRRLLEAIGREDLQAVTSLVVCQELIYLLARWQRTRQGPALPQAQRVVGNVIALCQEVFTPTLAELQQALQGYNPQQHDFNDRLIVQGMKSHAVERIVTADKGFDQAGHAGRVDPLTLAEQLI